MTRLENLERKNWKVQQSMNSNTVFATKNNGLIKVKGTSITDIHKKIIGY